MSQFIRIFLIVVTVVGSLSLGAAQYQSFVDEWGGTYDGPKVEKRMIARNPEGLHEMIQVFRKSVEKLIPESGFDFNRYMLAGISLGQKTTGGYSVKN